MRGGNLTRWYSGSPRECLTIRVSLSTTTGSHPACYGDSSIRADRNAHLRSGALLETGCQSCPALPQPPPHQAVHQPGKPQPPPRGEARLFRPGCFGHARRGRRGGRRRLPGWEPPPAPGPPPGWALLPESGSAWPRLQPGRCAPRRHCPAPELTLALALTWPCRVL